MSGADVELGDGVELVSHVAVAGRTTIGEGTRIFPFASIGHQPQDLKYKGEASRLVIGRNNIIREHVTMNPGTEGGGMVTRIGDDCLFMVGVHVAHDCIDRRPRHHGQQRDARRPCRDRRLCSVRRPLGGASVRAHRPACDDRRRDRRRARRHSLSARCWATARGSSGLNIVGMQRRGFSREEIQALRNAYQMLFGERGRHLCRAARGGRATASPACARARDARLHRARIRRAACASRRPMAARLRHSRRRRRAAAARSSRPAARAPARSSCLPSRASPIPARSRTCRMPGSGSARPARGCASCARTASRSW